MIATREEQCHYQQAQLIPMTVSPTYIDLVSGRRGDSVCENTMQDGVAVLRLLAALEQQPIATSNSERCDLRQRVWSGLKYN